MRPLMQESLMLDTLKLLLLDKLNKSVAQDHD